MSTMTRPRTVDERIRAALAARDEGMAAALNGDEEKAHNVRLVDEMIEIYASRRIPFSANDIRDPLPEACAPLMGSCFGQASRRGVIVPAGPTGVTSTKRNTHAKPVGLWIGPPPAFPEPVDPATQPSLLDLIGDQP